MQRRELLKAMVAAGMLPSAGLLSAPARAEVTRYEGPVYLVLFASGGWDVTSFCDPKDGLIQPSGSGSAVRINNWSASEPIQSAHGIDYAPFADNASLFTNHGNKMLVLNGLDAQTNAHSAGVRHVFSGRFADGYPAVTALAAAQHGAGLPLAFLSNGGYRETAGLTSFSLMQDPSTLGNLVNTNEPQWGAHQYHRPESLGLMDQYRQARMDRLQARATLTRRLSQASEYMENSAAGRDQLKTLNQYLPETSAPTVDADGNWFPLLRQIQLSLVSMAAGLTVAADVVHWGFDTHANHDSEHRVALRNLAAGVDYLWQEAANLDSAHGTNLTGRLRVVIASDFSRTPWYNDGAGKDHWPIGSAVLMQNGGFSRAVVGQTTATHDALGLDPNLEASETGTILTPAHFQTLLRHWSGTNTSAYQQLFPLDDSGLDLRALV
ncbi:DUF1501 domain-containing protein [Reinekea blandensis]|uniref:Tat (Twin-arginine translocation) pathway signal sequence domain protein n=1 Tax=Reinekea blandensis MED297 TaxID=314283 RepID=A4BKG9_9GAMM|nr:DUF1501 domain-containing protein [Reinekea blandensis]EAR07368.1 hypothetical protein MED297_05429 [Reinekea sp. MED297] [Reinekea blandensis MED297]